MIETSPPEGTVVERGTQVTLVVSRGAEPVTVPNVVGSSRASAERALGAVDLVAEVTERETTEAEEGVVLEQDPASGTSVAPGSTVAIVVASAPPDVEVPDVTTNPVPEAEAQEALEDAGFTVAVRDTTVTDPAQDGIVVGQDPAPGELLPPGSRVVIEVGRLARARADADPGARGGHDPVRVAVLFGGRSSEHEISRMSGRDRARRA